MSSAKEGIREALVGSHRRVAFLGGAALLPALVGLGALFWMADRVATESAPATQAALVVALDIETTLSTLRGWTTTGEAKTAQARNDAWASIWVHLDQLQKAAGSARADAVVQLRRTLADLHEQQWHIADVANTDGNHPFNEVVEHKARFVANEAMLAVTSLIEIERRRPDASLQRLGQFADTRFHLALSAAALERLASENTGSVRQEFASGMGQLTRVLGSVAEQGVTEQQRQLVAQLNRELAAFERHADRAMALAERYPRGVAAQLLRTDAMPLATRARSQIEQLVDELGASAQNDTDRMETLGWGLALGLSLLMLLGLWMARRIALRRAEAMARPVLALAEGAAALANGELTTDIPESGDREVAGLIGSFNRMRATLTSAQREAHATNEELTRQAVKRDARARLDGATRGDLTLEELGDNFLVLLVKEADVVAAGLYVVDSAAAQPSLLWVTGHGRELVEDSPLRSIPIGDGVVGQAARDGAIRRLTAIPEDWVVAGATVAGRPRELLAIPLLAGTDVVGVLEVTLLQHPDEDMLDYLDAARRTLGVAVGSALARRDIGQLLKRTQGQAEELERRHEELQAQQEELRQTNEELQQQSNELERQTSQLEEQKSAVNEKNVELERAGRYKSEFLANMSHELRTPLNSMLILSNLLSENKSGRLSDKEVEWASTVHHAGADLLNLINDILDISKVEAGRLEIQLESLDIRGLVASWERTFTPVAGERGLVLKMEVDPDVPEHAQLDSQRVSQVVRNLVGNALKFTSKGSVSVAVTSEADHLCIRVADTGIGIEPTHLGRVFEVFRQADGTTSRRFGGTGLGLPIARQLARLMGGDIEVESVVGEGSTFTARIPIVAGAPPIVAAPQPTASARSTAPRAVGAKTIVIIEDDPGFASILADLARDRGFEPIMAADGETGLRLVREHLPVGLMLDLHLPGMDGWAVLEALKEDVRTRHIPVHMVSADDSVHEAESRGAIGALRKPVDATALRAAFAKLEMRGNTGVKRLLLVEDDQHERVALRELLGGLDVEILERAMGDEALEALATEELDCAILDLQLPDQSGLDVLNEARARGIQLPPVLIYTGTDLSESEVAELERHAEAVIVKGVHSAERLLDETRLFLHSVVATHPPLKKQIPAAASLTGRTALVVDDDMRNVFALSSILESNGMHVLVGRNGLVGIEKLEEHADTVDVVLMDVMMPELDGMEATRRIRSDPRFKSLPIIMVTAKAMRGDAEKCLAAGASDYLPKPIDTAQLLSLLRVWLR